MRVAGFFSSLLPILVAYVSHEGLQAFLDRYVQQATTGATGLGWDEGLVAFISVVLGAVVSGIVAWYKKLRDDELSKATEDLPRARGFTDSEPPANPFLYGS